MRPIDADGLRNTLKEKQASFKRGHPNWLVLDLFITLLDKADTLKMRPEEQARWVKSYTGLFECSKCGVNNHFGYSNYCPNCGRLMSGGDE